MTDEKISKEELKELREDILETKPKPLEANKKLIFDGRQYSLRIPKKIIDEAEINNEKDEFKIKLDLPDPSTKEKPKLNIELIRNEK